jgi:dephospho-CoA kinase
MLTIALTGGIGSGKSTAATEFAELGVPVIDADVIAHDLVEPGSQALQMLIETFGSEIKREDGSLNRELLRSWVFNNDNKRHQLESIMHPLIREEIQRQLAASDSDYKIMVVPLLIETGNSYQYDRLLVIDASEATQQRRVMQRNGLTLEQFKLIQQAQCSRQRRLAAADDIIYNNDDDIESLKSQVLALHQRYVSQSRHI